MNNSVSRLVSPSLFSAAMIKLIWILKRICEVMLDELKVGFYIDFRFPLVFLM